MNMEAVSKEEILYKLYKFGVFHQVFFTPEGHLVINMRVGFFNILTLEQFKKELTTKCKLYNTNVDEVYSKAKSAIDALADNIFNFNTF